MKTQSFDDWMNKVDSIIQNRVGCSAADLIDYCYMDDFEDGYTPAQSARNAIQAANE